ncbi:MAG: regulatory iron-sulfur-containing complex subunit RicT [Gemmatimonadota bacterium]
MSDLIEVAFKGNRKEFYRWEDVVPPPAPRTHVIVEGDRGEDLGQVHAIGPLAEQRYAGVAHGVVLGEATRRIVRVARPDDIRKAQALPDENETTRRAAMAQVRALGLQMKVTDADWQWDHRKLTLYFTAEKRVDFRTLVRDLAATFKARIELKQIGVRDEAKRLDGIGRCGRQYCSASWLPDLRPVNLGVAKDQKLSLNPTQISGACGRLMCCLRYEHEFYVSSRKRFPKEGKIITTLKGEEKVMLNDIFHDRVTLRGADGESRIITLLELKRETSAWTPGGTEEYSVADARDAAEEGVLPFDDAPTLTSRTRVPPSDRKLPVLPERPEAPPPRAAAPQPPVVPPAPDVPPAAIVAAPAVTDEDVSDEDDDGAEDGDDGATATDATGEAPKRRRRRGRRGGRRGRGSRPNAPGDEPAAE